MYLDTYSFRRCKGYGYPFFPTMSIFCCSDYLLRLDTGDKPVEPKVLMLLRSSAQRAWATESADGGIHWGQVHQMFDLPNPDSKLSLLRLNPGGVYIRLVFHFFFANEFFFRSLCLHVHWDE